MNCQKCGAKCERDEVDIGVGVQCGPWGCPDCGWSEWSEYDLSEGQSPIHESGWIKDQCGGLTPPKRYVSSEDAER